MLDTPILISSVDYLTTIFELHTMSILTRSLICILYQPDSNFKYPVEFPFYIYNSQQHCLVLFSVSLISWYFMTCVTTG